jgi:predicted TIM-barrel fold metal-dependent hydrolase
MRIYEACEERGLPVMVSRPEIPLASSVMEFDRPGNWDEVARNFPNLKIVIGGLGFPWIDETLALLQKHENLFADLSIVVSRPWQVRTALLNAHSLGVLDQILFASGWPATTPAHAIETLYSLNTFNQGNPQPSVPRSEIRKIIERDSLSALGIERTPGITKQNEPDTSKFKSIRTDDEANQVLPVD